MLTVQTPLTNALYIIILCISFLYDLVIISFAWERKFFYDKTGIIAFPSFVFIVQLEDERIENLFIDLQFFNVQVNNVVRHINRVHIDFPRWENAFQ